MKFQIVRCWNGSKGYGKIFDSLEDAKSYLQNSEKIQADIEDGFTFNIEVVEND